MGDTIVQWQLRALHNTPGQQHVTSGTFIELLRWECDECLTVLPTLRRYSYSLTRPIWNASMRLVLTIHG